MTLRSFVRTSLPGALLSLGLFCIMGCEDDSTTSETTNIYGPTNDVEEAAASPAIVIAQDGQGNIVSVNTQTGEIVPVSITQIGTGNIAVVDIKLPAVGVATNVVPPSSI